MATKKKATKKTVTKKTASKKVTSKKTSSKKKAVNNTVTKKKTAKKTSKKVSSVNTVNLDNLIHGIEPYVEKAKEKYMNPKQVDHFKNILLAWKQKFIRRSVKNYSSYAR